MTIVATRPGWRHGRAWPLVVRPYFRVATSHGSDLSSSRRLGSADVPPVSPRLSRKLTVSVSSAMASKVSVARPGHEAPPSGTCAAPAAIVCPRRRCTSDPKSAAVSSAAWIRLRPRATGSRTQTSAPSKDRTYQNLAGCHSRVPRSMPPICRLHPAEPEAVGPVVS